MITAPSVKTLTERLGVEKITAMEIRLIIKGWQKDGSRVSGVMRKLGLISELINGNGVEAIRTVDDTQNDFFGIEYVNMGETYAETICYDWKAGRWLCCSWGSIVESNTDYYI